MKVYAYQNCGTCRKALKHLDKMRVDYLAIPIREQPPTKPELKKMLKIYHGDIRRLFNTSGEDYRKMQLKDKLASMSEEQALDLLARNGGLVKRPFVLTDSGGTVGFREDEWDKLVRSQGAQRTS